MEGRERRGVVNAVAKGLDGAHADAAAQSSSGDVRAPLHKIMEFPRREPPRPALCNAVEGAADRRDEEIASSSGRRPTENRRSALARFGGDKDRGPEYALIRAAGAFWGRPRAFGERAMSLGTILVMILIIFLLGGFSGRFRGYGYGYGHSGMDYRRDFDVLLILLLLGKI